MTIPAGTAAPDAESREGTRDRSYLLDVAVGALALIAALVLNLLQH